MRRALGTALKNAMATIGAGGLFVLGFVLLQLYRQQLGEWEASRYPAIPCSRRPRSATARAIRRPGDARDRPPPIRHSR